MIERISSKQAEALRLYQELKSLSKVAKAMGVSKSTAAQFVERAKKHTGLALAPVPVPEDMSMTKTTVQYHLNRETGAYEVTNEWRRLSPAAEGLEQFAQALAARTDGKGPKIAKPRKQVKEDTMFTLILPDLHIGERIWAAECGVNWDGKIAVTEMKRAIDEVLHRAGPVGTIVIKNLGDLTHADNNSNATPKSKHQLDVDGRHNLNMERAEDLLTHTINHAASVCPNVVYRSVRGNHDEETNYHMSMILRAYYRHTKHVQIVMDRRKHQYWTWGVTAFMDTHGDTGRPQRLKDVFATQPEWAGAVCRRIHSGHFHVDRVIPFAGCRFEIFEPPIPQGKYATEESFGGDGQKIVGIFYDRNRGEMGRVIEPIVPAANK